MPPEVPVSLDVPTALLERAATGHVDDAEFVAVIRDSLPYAWQIVSDVAGRVPSAGPASPGEHAAPFVDHAVPPPTEAARGQLLRALASDAIRGALERHFGVKLAFQNCHRVAAFPPSAVDSPAYRAFVSPLAQIRNQSPDLRDC
jgi:hypothetical protein